MKIQAVMNRYNHNLLTPTKGNMSKPHFGNEYCDNNYSDSFYVYEPNEPFSPQRQAIENRYGRKMAELADLVETVGLSPMEYEVRLKQIEKERKLALKLLKDEYSL